MKTHKLYYIDEAYRYWTLFLFACFFDKFH
jgi:hypothetical protein